MAEQMFPVIPAGIPAQAGEQIGCAPAFAFYDPSSRAGEFELVDGAPRVRVGVAAVRGWFELTLRQTPDAIPVYRTDGTAKIGIDRTLLRRGLPEGFVYAEVERQIRDTASFCPAVRTVDTFRFTRLRRGLQVEFTARLHTGESTEVMTHVERE